MDKFFWWLRTMVVRFGRGDYWYEGESVYGDCPERHDLLCLHVYLDDRAEWLYIGQRMLVVW